MLSYWEFINEALHKSSLISNDVTIKLHKNNVSLYCIVYRAEEIIGYFQLSTYGDHYNVEEMYGTGIGDSLYQFALLIASNESKGLGPSSSGNTRPRAMVKWNNLKLRKDVDCEKGICKYNYDTSSKYNFMISRSVEATETEVEEAKKRFSDKYNLNEDNVSKSISGLDKFGISHDYELIVSATSFEEDNHEKYLIEFFPSNEQFEDKLVERFNLKDRDALDDAWDALGDHYYEINKASIYHGEIKDKMYVDTPSGGWGKSGNFDKSSIFLKDNIYFLYKITQEDPNDMHKLRMYFSSTKDKKYNGILEQWKRDTSRTMSFQYAIVGEEVINPKEILKTGYLSFEITAVD